jgi:hypothetical protein
MLLHSRLLLHTERLAPLLLRVPANSSARPALLLPAWSAQGYQHLRRRNLRHLVRHVAPGERNQQLLQLRKLVNAYSLQPFSCAASLSSLDTKATWCATVACQLACCNSHILHIRSCARLAVQSSQGSLCCTEASQQQRLSHVALLLAGGARMLCCCWALGTPARLHVCFRRQVYVCCDVLIYVCMFRCC